MDLSQNAQPFCARNVTVKQEDKQLSENDSFLEEKGKEFHEELSGDSCDERLKVFVSPSENSASVGSKVAENDGRENPSVKEDMDAENECYEAGTVAEDSMDTSNVKTEPLSPAVNVKEEPIEENYDEETETEEDECERRTAEKETNILRQILDRERTSSVSEQPHPVFMFSALEMKNAVKREPDLTENDGTNSDDWQFYSDLISVDLASERKERQALQVVLKRRQAYKNWHQLQHLIAHMLICEAKSRYTTKLLETLNQHLQIPTVASDLFPNVMKFLTQPVQKGKLKQSKIGQGRKAMRKSPWQKPMEKANCLVCNIACNITVNRKILSLPFCKRCKKSYFYQMSARLHKGGASGRTSCAFEGNCEIDYRLRKRCCYCLRQKFDAALKQGQLKFKEMEPFDPFSEENINRYRWGKTLTVRQSLTETDTKDRRKNDGIEKASSRRRPPIRDARLVAEALKNDPRIMLTRCDESPVLNRQWNGSQPSTFDYFRCNARLSLDSEARNQMKDGLFGGYPVTEKYPGEKLLNHNTFGRSDGKSQHQLDLAKNGIQKNNFSHKHETILSQLKSPTISDTIPEVSFAGTIMLDANNIQPPTAIYQAQSTEECKNLLSSVKNKLSEKIRAKKTGKRAIQMPKSKTLKVLVFPCGHACRACNCSYSTKWLKNIGYKVERPAEQQSTNQHQGHDHYYKGKQSAQEQDHILDLSIINKLLKQKNLVIDHIKNTINLPPNLQKSNRVTYNIKTAENVSFVNSSGVIDLTQNFETVRQPDPIVNQTPIIIPPIYFNQTPDSKSQESVRTKVDSFKWATTTASGPSMNAPTSHLLSQATVVNVPANVLPSSVLQGNTNVSQLHTFTLSGGINSTGAQSLVRFRPDGSMIIPLSYNKPTRLNIPVPMQPPGPSFGLNSQAAGTQLILRMPDPNSTFPFPNVKKALRKKIGKN